jgi:hypothetical protein
MEKMLCRTLELLIMKAVGGSALHNSRAVDNERGWGN